MQTYFYKNSLEKLGWTPFCLTEEHGRMWNLFCQKIGLKNPQDPNPYFSDYLIFMNELEIEHNNKSINHE